MARNYLVPVDMNKNETRNLVLHNLASAPGTPVEGQVYYDTTGGDKTAYFWDGTAWVPMKSGAPTFGSPIASAVGDTADDGANTTVARSDHRHAREAFGGTAELAVVDAAAEAAGTSLTVAHGDHKHAASVGTPVTIGTANANGSADTLARSDHVHLTRSHDHSAAEDGTTLTPAALIVPLATGPAQTANGSAVWDSDGFWLTIGDGTGRRFLYPVLDATSDPVITDGNAAADGTETTTARKDHKHLLSLGNVTAQTSFGASSANGSATSASRSDHVHGTPTHDGAAHSAVTLSHLLAPTADFGFGGFKLTSLGTPTSDTDAATKAYVDAAAVGIDWKASVRAATTAAGTLATSFEDGDTVGGVAVATGNRILIKDQADPEENGIYVVAASGAPTRATDADANAEVTAGLAVFVEEGTNADTGWLLTTDGAIVVGTTELTFTQFTGLGQVTAGDGLTKTGNTLDVGEGSGIDVTANAVAIDTAVVVRKFAASVGDGVATSYNVDHNLNTTDVTVQVFTVADGSQVEPDITRTTVNRVVIAFTTAPTTNQYRVVVHG